MVNTRKGKKIRDSSEQEHDTTVAEKRAKTNVEEEQTRHSIMPPNPSPTKKFNPPAATPKEGALKKCKEFKSV